MSEILPSLFMSNKRIIFLHFYVKFGGVGPSVQKCLVVQKCSVVLKELWLDVSWEISGQIFPEAIQVGKINYHNIQLLRHKFFLTVTPVSYWLLAPYLWLNRIWTLLKQTTNWVTPTMMSSLAAHLEIPSLRSHFVPVSVGHRGKKFLQFLGQGRLIHLQLSTVLHFDIFFFMFLNWAVAILCISCWMCATDCQHVSLVYFCCLFLLLRFHFVFFNLPQSPCTLSNVCH